MSLAKENMVILSEVLGKQKTEAVYNMNQLQLYIFKGYYENHIAEPVKWSFLRSLTTNTYIQRDICIIIIQSIYKH